MGVNDREQNRKEEAKRSRGKSDARSETAWRGFVECNLSEAQKKGGKAKAPDQAGLWLYLEGRVDSGYRFSWSRDEAHDSEVLALTCRNDKDLNQGLTLTTRGGSFLSALTGLWVKDVFVLQGEWDRAATESGKGMSEDDFA